MYGKKNSGEKINEMPKSEVSSDENSTSSDVENDILEDLRDKIKCLKPYPGMLQLLDLLGNVPFFLFLLEKLENNIIFHYK